MYDTLLFICAMCKREVRDYPHRNGRDKHLQPLCRRCEDTHVFTWNGRMRDRGRITDGCPMDRRKAKQLFALAERLHGEAACREWEQKHGRA